MRIIFVAVALAFVLEPKAVSKLRRWSTSDVYEALVRADEAGLASVVATQFDAIDEAVLTQLRQADGDDKAAADRAFQAIVQASHVRMEEATERLKFVLDAGELLEMDRRLSNVFKERGLDGAFLAVLSLNMANAQETKDDDPNKARIFSHLYTRAQEEWEKRLGDQTDAVLHRLSRTDEPVIRRNILTHYLAPQTHILVPNKDPVPIDPPKPPLISSDDLATAIARAVAKARTLDVDGDAVRACIEDFRSIAKEARLVIIEHAPPDDVRRFESALADSFTA